MSEEVVHSSSHLTDDDLKAIAVYLKSVGSAGESAPTPIAATDPRMVAGQAIYKDSCAGCHTDAGTGFPGLFAKLAGSHAVQSDDPTTMIRVVIAGSQGVATSGAPTSPAMPSFSWRLNETQVASVLTYVRNAWGNAAAPVTADQVNAVKANLAKSN
jgi:mono/diheme cytochrome c family protein